MGIYRVLLIKKYEYDRCAALNVLYEYLLDSRRSI